MLKLTRIRKVTSGPNFHPLVFTNVERETIVDPYRDLLDAQPILRSSREVDTDAKTHSTLFIVENLSEAKALYRLLREHPLSIAYENLVQRCAERAGATYETTWRLTT